MNVRKLVFVVAAALAAAMPARAALLLQYFDVTSQGNGINAGIVSAGATPLASLNMNVGDVAFVQVVLFDTLYTGPGTGTVAWNPVLPNGGPTSKALGAFFMQFDGIPGVAVNPITDAGMVGDPTAQLVNTVKYASANAGTNPPTFTRFGGLINGGQLGLVPVTATKRISLFNLEIDATGGGTGFFHLRDQNPASNSNDCGTIDGRLINQSPSSNNLPGTITPIDTLLFSDTGVFPTTKTYDLPVTVIGVPEPSSMALCGLAFAGIGYRKLRRKTAKAAV